MAYKTRLGGNSATFDSMMRNGFGVVTVMNAKVYPAMDVDTLKGKTTQEAKDIVKTFIEMLKREITNEQDLKKLEDAIAFRNVSNHIQ